jgi:cell division protease FtsH
LVYGELTTGASNDLKVATGMARKLVMNYGMSEEIGPIVLGDQHEMVFLGREISEQRNYSEAVAQKIDSEVSLIMKEGLARATKVLTDYKSHLETIAQRLVKDETLEQEAFFEIVRDIIPKEKQQSADADLAESPAAAV